MHIRFALTFTILLSFIFLTDNEVNSQDKWWKNKKYKSESTRLKYELCKKTFKDISYGFQTRNINLITLYFDSQVYLNIISNEKGYYSSNQSELILTDFMDYYRIENIKYNRSSRYNSYAFVNGVYTYWIGSAKKNLRLTISLKYYIERWYIDQITIN